MLVLPTLMFPSSTSLNCISFAIPATKSSRRSDKTTAAANKAIAQQTRRALPEQLARSNSEGRPLTCPPAHPPTPPPTHAEPASSDSRERGGDHHARSAVAQEQRCSAATERQGHPQRLVRLTVLYQRVGWIRWEYGKCTKNCRAPL